MFALVIKREQLIKNHYVYVYQLPTKVLDDYISKLGDPPSRFACQPPSLNSAYGLFGLRPPSYVTITVAVFN